MFYIGLRKITNADIILIKDHISPAVSTALIAYGNTARMPGSCKELCTAAALNVLNNPSFPIRLPMREYVVGIQAAIAVSSAATDDCYKMKEANIIHGQAVRLAFIAVVAQRMTELARGRVNITMSVHNDTMMYGPWSPIPTEGIECAICLEMRFGYNVKTDCGHSFCGKCMCDTVKARKTIAICCPMCRNNVLGIDCQNRMTVGNLVNILYK